MIAQSDRHAVEAVVSELEQAWNAGDGRRFADVFAQDGQQVNIFGAQLDGADAIAEQHARVFSTVFRRSVNHLHILDLREAGSGVLLARISSAVDVPDGPMKGVLRTIGSLVIRTDTTRPQVLLFHNTRVAEPPPAHGSGVTSMNA